MSHDREIPEGMIDQTALAALADSIVEWVKKRDKEGACLASDGIRDASRNGQRDVIEELHAILWTWSEGQDEWQTLPNWEDRGEALERLNRASHFDDLSYFWEIKRLWLYIVANVPTDE
jgi:hypothetical protein